jgi:hypothetical protein
MALNAWCVGFGASIILFIFRIDNARILAHKPSAPSLR